MICMFSGALLLLTDSLCVYLCPFSNGPLRDTSFTEEKRRADPRTFDRTYKPRKRRHLPILLLQTNETRRPVQNQPDSAGFFRISRIPPNQQDYIESARFLRIEQTLVWTRGLRIQQTFAHGFTSSSHISHSYPQPGTQPCRVICHQGTHRTFSGSWGITVWAQGHCLLTVVSCPVPSLVGLCESRQRFT